MRKKKCILTFQPTTKNKVYLERLGFIDGRSGKKRKGDSKSISECINQCITMVFESQMNPYQSMATNDELTKAWVKFEMTQLNKRQIDIGIQMQELASRMPATENPITSGCDVR